MPCGWEGNRRSGVALAMRYDLQWFIHLRAHGLRKGDEHPAYTPHGHDTLYVCLTFQTQLNDYFKARCSSSRRLPLARRVYRVN